MKNGHNLDSRIAVENYIAIILLVISSGTAYFYLYHAGITLFALLFFSFLFLVRKHPRFKINLFLLVYSLLIPINYFLFGYDMNLVGDVIFLISTYFFLIGFNYNTFRRGLLNITVILCVLSIILELLFVLDIITPELYGDSVSGLHGHYLFAFHAFGGGLWGTTTQLYGIFWEPGIYQMVINIAIILNLDMLDRSSKVSYKKIKFIILITALILTRSTTGYLTLGTIMVGYFLYKSTHSNTSKILAILSMIVFWLVIVYSSVIADKFSEENASFVARSKDWVTLTQSILENPIWGSGVNSAAFDKIAQKYDMPGSKSAGLLFQTAQMGIFWLIAFYYSLRKEFKKRDIRLPMVFFFIAITFLGMGEPLAYSPIMLILVLPFNNYKDDKNFIYRNSNI